MAQYLYLIRPTRTGMVSAGPTPEEAALVARHFAFLQELLRTRVLLMAGRTQTSDANTFGIVVFEAPDDEAAAAVMRADPAIMGGVMRAELYPYKVALWAADGPTP